MVVSCTIGIQTMFVNYNYWFYTNLYLKSLSPVKGFLKGVLKTYDCEFKTYV